MGPFFFTTYCIMVTGLLFWGKGEESEKQQPLEIEPKAPGFSPHSLNSRRPFSTYAIRTPIGVKWKFFSIRKEQCFICLKHLDSAGKRLPGTETEAKTTNLSTSFSSGCSKRMCLYFDNDVQAYPAGSTAYNIVTGPHLVLVVVALKVAYMVQALELDHQKQIQN